MDNRYTMQRRVRYWNYVTNCEVQEKGKNVYCFVSTFEYNIYRSLKARFFDTDISIQPHPYFVSGHLKWKIDFRLTAYSNYTQKLLGKLADLCNQTNYNNPMGFLYIEAKGVLNKGFIKHLDYIYTYNPENSRSFIIIGSTNSAYTYEVPEEKKIHIKPIVSAQTFTYWLNKCLT